MEIFESMQLNDWLFLVVLLVSTVINFFSNRGNNKNISEVLMRFRSPNYQEKDKEVGQTFDKYRKNYVLNEATNELEETDELTDIQALIDSERPSCLEETLKRLLPDELKRELGKRSLYGECDLLADKLDRLSDAMDMACNMAERIRVELKLGDDLSVDEVYEKAEDYLDNLQKEVKANETSKSSQTVQSGSSPDETAQQSQAVPPNGKEVA